MSVFMLWKVSTGSCLIFLSCIFWGVFADGSWDPAALPETKNSFRLLPDIRIYLLLPPLCFFSRVTLVGITLFLTSPYRTKPKPAPWKNFLIFCQVSITHTQNQKDVSFAKSYRNEIYRWEVRVHIFEETLSSLSGLLFKENMFLHASVTAANFDEMRSVKLMDTMEKWLKDIFEVFGLLMFSFMCVDVKVAWNKNRKRLRWGTKKKKKCVVFVRKFTKQGLNLGLGRKMIYS